MEGFPEVPKPGEEEKLELTLDLELRLSVGGSSSKKPKRAVKALKGSKPAAEESKVLPLFHTDGPDLSDPDRKRQYQAFCRKEAKRRLDEKRLRRGIVRGQAPAAPPASTSSPVQNVGVVREHGNTNLSL